MDIVIIQFRPTQIRLLQGAANAYQMVRDEMFERWWDSVLVLDDKEAWRLSCQIEPQGSSAPSSTRESRMRKRAQYVSGVITIACHFELTALNLKSVVLICMVIFIRINPKYSWTVNGAYALFLSLFFFFLLFRPLHKVQFDMLQYQLTKNGWACMVKMSFKVAHSTSL